MPASAAFDPATNAYTINSAGYNVWYTRDEFRYLFKRMSGDVSLAADIAFPDPNGYGDRKAVLIIRQDLDDDAKEAIVALHGLGMIHLARRPEEGLRVSDTEYRIGGRGRPGGKTPDSLVPITAKRIGIEKRGDAFALFVSLEGEPMHQFGPPITLHLTEPFYVPSASARISPTSPTPPSSPTSRSQTQPVRFINLCIESNVDEHPHAQRHHARAPQAPPRSRPRRRLLMALTEAHTLKGVIVAKDELAEGTNAQDSQLEIPYYFTLPEDPGHPSGYFGGHLRTVALS